MGHLSSINGCGVRSGDSLWEKRANVSRDICLSVRAEEVSLPKDLGALSLFFWEGGVLLHAGACKHLLSWMEMEMGLIQDPILEAVSDLTPKHFVFLFDAFKTVLCLLFSESM